MSGGHFNYAQYKISMIADEVEDLIRSNDDESLNEWGYPKGRGFTPETIAEFQRGLRVLREAFIYVQRIDWLVSADDSEEGFLKRLEDDLRSLNTAPQPEKEEGCAQCGKQASQGWALYCVECVGGKREWVGLQEEVDELRQVCRNVYEVWAGSEGVPIPETCTEGYLLRLIEQMRDEAKAGLPVDAVNMSEEHVQKSDKNEHN